MAIHEAWCWILMKDFFFRAKSYETGTKRVIEWEWKETSDSSWCVCKYRKNLFSWIRRPKGYLFESCRGMLFFFDWLWSMYSCWTWKEFNLIFLHFQGANLSHTIEHPSKLNKFSESLSKQDLKFIFKAFNVSALLLDSIFQAYTAKNFLFILVYDALITALDILLENKTIFLWFAIKKFPLCSSILSVCVYLWSLTFLFIKFVDALFGVT